MTQPDPVPEPQPAQEDAPDPSVSAAARIAELEAKLAETTDKALRALAEAENTRKRLEKERLDTAKFAISSFARELLSVADNLRRALNAITPEAREKNPELKNIYTGVEATERELLGIFERNGIKKIEPLHQKFDPNLHEVMFEGDGGDKEPGTVIQILEPGYTLHDRLLRPARVGIAKGDGAQAGAKVDTQA